MTSSCWPTPDQELLLGACLRGGSDAISAWRRWRRRVDLDDVDPASFRLLPLLYRTLAKHGVADADLARLAGVYRWHWVRTQLQVRAAAQVLDRLTAAGVPTLVLKGGAVGPRYYGDQGVRPMDDLDVLVPPAHAAAAVALLRGDGWTARRPDVERRLQFRHSADLQHADGGAVDLHWRVFNEFGGTLDEDAASWDAAEPLRLAGRDTRALCATDELLLACGHGLRWSPVAPVRWLADVATICATAGPQLDAERLRRIAGARGLVAPVAETAGWLRDALGLALPPALAGMIGAPARRRDRWAHRVRMAPHRAGERLAPHAAVRAPVAPARAPGFALRDYSAFLACQWELPDAACRRCARSAGLCGASCAAARRGVDDPPARRARRAACARPPMPHRTRRRPRAGRHAGVGVALLLDRRPRPSGCARARTSASRAGARAATVRRFAGLRTRTRDGAVFVARRGRHRPTSPRRSRPCPRRRGPASCSTCGSGRASAASRWRSAGATASGSCSAR
ncbi:MAG: nucleotidyltransferase family protein [bacterium]|nr:nucleotidyltransferase family protein [bacterium]